MIAVGYILPINNEQSNQYTNRIIRKDGPPFVVKPVEKVTMRAKLKGKTDYEDQYEEVKARKKSEITGKGKHFNETV